MKVLTSNKKAVYNYEILDTYIAGISLLGCEVKSIMDGKCSLSEGWIYIKDGSAYLKQVHVNRYKNRTMFDENVNETRDRRLLLKKQEILKIEKQSREKTISVIPLDIHYSENKKIKVKIAVCKGKKLHDKRETIKNRDINRDMLRQKTGNI